MNPKLAKLAVCAGVAGYIDSTDPSDSCSRLYFTNSQLTLQQLEFFAELIIKRCIEVAELNYTAEHQQPRTYSLTAIKIKEYWQ